VPPPGIAVPSTAGVCYRFLFPGDLGSWQRVYFYLAERASRCAGIGAWPTASAYQGIASSVAVKFDLYDDAGEALTPLVSMQRRFLRRCPPSTCRPPASICTLGHTACPHYLRRHNIDVDFNRTVTSVSFTTSAAIDIPAAVGGVAAYAGFTAVLPRAAGHPSDFELDLRGQFRDTSVGGNTPFAPEAGKSPARSRHDQRCRQRCRYSLHHRWHGADHRLDGVRGSDYGKANQTLKAVAIAKITRTAPSPLRCM